MVNQKGNGPTRHAQVLEHLPPLAEKLEAKLFASESSKV